LVDFGILSELAAREARTGGVTAIAHFHRTGSALGLGHTVNFGRPWLPTSSCTHGLGSLPYLDGPDLEWLHHSILGGRPSSEPSRGERVTSAESQQAATTKPNFP
jgi:hypothetical protein